MSGFDNNIDIFGDHGRAAKATATLEREESSGFSGGEPDKSPKAEEPVTVNPEEETKDTARTERDIFEDALRAGEEKDETAPSHAEEENVQKEAAIEAEEESMRDKTAADEEEENEQAGEEETMTGEEGSEDQTDGSKNEKRSFFKKKKDKKDEKIEELTNQLKRQMAEFDNFRKRTDKEKSSMFDMGARSTVEKILPIVDNFERGLAMKKDEERTPFTDGMEMVYKQLQAVLEGMDVKPIEAVGQPFDPNFHNAIMQDTESDAPENTVVEEFQKGYTYKGNVIRYSMVKVKA